MKKTIALLLLLTMLFASVSCAEKAGTTAASTDTTVAEQTTEGETEPQLALPASNFEGFTCTFIGKAPDGGAFGVKDVAVESETGDAFNDAVYRRNVIIEDAYNVNIEFIPSPDSSVCNYVNSSILAADDYYDVIYDGLQPVVSLSQNNSLIDLYTLDNFDFEKPWWDADVNKELSITGKLFVTYGEHMIGPKSGLYCLFFNKKLAENLTLGDLYQFVRDDKWTMEQFGTLASAGNFDLDGDGKMTSADQFGHITETYSGYTFMIAEGYKIASKDEDDLPILTVIDDNVYSKVDRMMSVLADKDITNYVGAVPGETDIWGAFWTGCFVADKFLFREGAMHDAPTLRDMDTDFGILPLPKYDDQQTRYYHTNSVYNAAMMCIPTSASDPDTVSFIIEAMAYYSKTMLTPVYYEVVLQGKTFRDNESEEMLDIIFNSKTFDIGAAFNWGGIQGIYTSICSNPKANFASSYAKIETKVATEMEKTIAIFSDGE